MYELIEAEESFQVGFYAVKSLHKTVIANRLLADQDTIILKHAKEDIVTTEIRELKLSEGKRVFIEVEIVEVNLPSQQGPADLPLGAEPTGVWDSAAVGMNLFQENIRNMAESVYESLKDLQPAEWTVEMNIGFKGTATPVPFIAGSEVEGGVKVIVTWKKKKEKEEKENE